MLIGIYFCLYCTSVIKTHVQFWKHFSHYFLEYLFCVIFFSFFRGIQMALEHFNQFPHLQLFICASFKMNSLVQFKILNAVFDCQVLSGLWCFLSDHSFFSRFIILLHNDLFMFSTCLFYITISHSFC